MFSLQLGNVIWNGRVHYDGSKSRQPVWYFKPACVPDCVGQKRFLKKGLSRFVSFLNEINLTVKTDSKKKQ